MEESFIELEEEQKENSEAFYLAILVAFDLALRKLQKEIAAWLVDSPKKRLTQIELKEFRDSIKDDPSLKRYLSRSRITVAEALEAVLTKIIHDMFKKYEDSIGDFLVDSYISNYYKTAYNIAVNTGKATSIDKLVAEEVEKLLRKPWAADGKIYSERISADKQRLVETVRAIIVRGTAMGASPSDMIRDVMKATKTSYSNAARLIATESSFVRSLANQHAFKRLNVEQYRFVATIDSRTSQICRSMHERIFDMGDFEVGVTAPPLHPRCRSVTVPIEPISDGEEIPSDLSYEDWFKEFVK